MSTEPNECWRLIGSRKGLLNFCKILNGYADDRKNAPLSEHEHYGPYWYLKITTWNEALITSQDIRGTFEDFKRLSRLTKQKLEQVTVDDGFVIDSEYSPKNEAKLIFEIKEDSFDPAKADPLL